MMERYLNLCAPIDDDDRRNRAHHPPSVLKHRFTHISSGDSLELGARHGPGHYCDFYTNAAMTRAATQPSNEVSTTKSGRAEKLS